MLSAMFSGKYGDQVDEEGYHIIHWDGKYFDIVLNYLRNGKLTIPLIQFNELELRKFYETVQYFAVEGLIKEFEEFYGLSDPGSHVNLLNSMQTGGRAKLIALAYKKGCRVFNDKTLNGDPNKSWQNNGCLIDQLPNEMKYISLRQNVDTGSTWTNAPGGVGTLEIDLTGRKIACQISRFLIFNMISDGAISHIKFYWHKSKIEAPKIYDESWIGLQKKLDSCRTG